MPAIYNLCPGQLDNCVLLFPLNILKGVFPRHCLDPLGRCWTAAPVPPEGLHPQESCPEMEREKGREKMEKC